MLLGILMLGATPARSETDCVPYCDFLHDYGPRDFTYLLRPSAPVDFTYSNRPGLFLAPRCRWDGACSPYLISSYPRRGRITVRSRLVPRR